MHPLLAQQVKDLLGVDQTQLAGVLQELTQLPTRTPQAAQLLAGLALFMERVDEAYRQRVMVPNLDVDGGPLRATDLTARQRMEAAVQEAQARVRRIANTVPGAVFQWQISPGQIRYTFLSDRVQDIRGLTPAALLQDSGLAVAQIVDADRQRVLDGVFEAARLHRGWRDEYRIVLPAGITRWIRGEINPESDQDADGTVTFTGIWQDITAEKQTSEELRLAKDNAEAANRAKSDFLANISHEIRTPLSGVIGMTELVLDTELQADQRENLEVVKASSQALLKVINDILDFSKLEAGKVLLESVSFHIGDLVRDALRAVAYLAFSKGLALRSDVGAAVPLWMLGDPGRLRQILLNLLGNAIKFTDHGDIVLSVACLVRHEQRCELVFSVRDSGIGIPADKIACIFEPFEQQDSSITRKYGGTGLGLSISARLAQAMGGRIEVDSQPGQGSVFRLLISLEPDPLGAVHHVPVHDQSGQGGLMSGALAHARALDVLLAEDNPVNQRLLETLLRRWGHHVTLAVDGVQALARLSERTFDVILMDMRMPLLDGPEVIRRYRQTETGDHTPAFAMTANISEPDRQRCLNAGMDDFIAKPIHAAELRAKLQGIALRGRPGVTLAGDEGGHCAITPSALAPAFDYHAALAQADQEVVDIIAATFLAVWPQDQEHMAHALAAGDAATVSQLAHALKGSLGLFNAQPAALLAHQLEQAATPGMSAGLVALWQRLQAQVHRLQQAVQDRTDAASAADAMMRPPP